MVAFYVLRDWVQKIDFNVNKNNLCLLSKNPAAINFLLLNPEIIDWDLLSKNPNAIEILRGNPNKINFLSLIENPNAHELLKNYVDIYIDDKYHGLIHNPNPKIFDLFKGQIDSHLYFKWLSRYSSKFDNKDHINFDFLSGNPSPEAIKILLENQDKICWSIFSSNTHPEAIKLLTNNPHKIDWFFLSSNTNPAAIKLLRLNPDKINWAQLSRNPSAIDLLYENQNNFYRFLLLENLNIFIVNKQSIFIMKLSRQQFNEYTFEYPRIYLCLKLISRCIMRCVCDTNYKLCRKLLMKKMMLD